MDSQRITLSISRDEDIIQSSMLYAREEDVHKGHLHNSREKSDR